MSRPIPVLIMAIAAILLLGGCGEEDGTTVGFRTLPTEVGRRSLVEDGDTLRPVRLQMVGDTLFVGYRGRPRIDILNDSFELLGRLDLIDPEPVIPTSFFVTDTIIVVTNHARNLVAIYDRNSNLQTSFSTMPDGTTTLSPFCVTCFGGVAYVGDAGQHGILAISLVTAEGVTEVGELILVIPSDTLHQIGFPSAVHVTPDGRLLAGDAREGKLRVFTCDGRYVYDFELPDLPRLPGLQGFGADNVIDPSLQDTTKFDPSLVHLQGRLHVPDASNGRVHMFNPLGEYIASYPPDGSLDRPSGIAVNWRKEEIYVADPATGEIITFSYTR